MANVLIEQGTMDNIADAIRAKNGSSNTYKPAQMPTAIENLPSGATLQSKSVSYTPSETAQSGTVTADSGYDGLSSVAVSVGAISSTYIGSGVTRKSAQTYTPTTSAQTIAANQYLTGVQTIAGDSDLVGSNIISTANIFNVQGTVVINKYYTGSSAPSSSLGNNGDIYLQS